MYVIYLLTDILGGQDSVDSIISIVLLPVLIFNTTFDLYKRTIVILIIKLVTISVEYLIVVMAAGKYWYGH